MSSQLEELMDNASIRNKLGTSFIHADLEPLLEYAHELRETDGVPFNEALNISAGKTHPAYGTPKP